MVREMIRLIRMGGILYLVVPNRLSFGLSRSRKRELVKIYGHHDFYTPYELMQLLKRAFKINNYKIKSYSSGFYWSVLNLVERSVHIRNTKVNTAIARIISS